MITVLILSSVILVAAFAASVRLGFDRQSETVAAATIGWVTLVAVPIYALGFTNRLTRLNLALASLVLSAATIAGCFRGGGESFSRRLVKEAYEVARMPGAGLALALRERSPVAPVLLVAAAVFIWNLLAAYYGPSWRSWDGLWYHEPIIGFTIQNHGFAIVDLPQTPIQKINGYPRLSEMLGLWFGIFAGRRLIDLPNVLLMPGFFCAIFASCRRQSVDTLSSLGWAGVGTTIPAYVEGLQTTFVDAALPLFVSAGFLFCTSRPLRHRDAILGAIALGLACNVKISGLFPAVALSFVTAARLLTDKSRPVARRIAAVLAGAAIVVGLSSATYLRDLILFKNPVWPDLKVDIPSLGIHWPGMWPWGSSSASTPRDQVNMAEPWNVLVGELTTRPFGVDDRSHKFIYKYGLGVMWIVVPLIAASGVVVLLRAAGQALRGHARAGYARRAFESTGTGLTAIVTLWAIVATSTALWAPRYNLHTIAIGVVIVCCAFERRHWAAMHQAVAFCTVVTAVMISYWDYTEWHGFPSASQMWRSMNTPYPARELSPDLGAPVNLKVGLARERELVAGSVVLTDDFGFPAILWNNDFSNRVLTMRPDANFPDAAEKVRADWVYAGQPATAQELLATGKWESLGPLYVEGWGTALHRKR